MVNFKTLSMAIAATTLSFFAIGINSAQAALLQFSFTTDQDGIGSFLLDTETPVSSKTIPLFDETGENLIGEGRNYPDAVSNFFFSSPGAGTLNYANVGFTLFPPNLVNDYFFGTIGPSQCDDPEADCPVNVALEYTGDSAELPTLSTNPKSYDLFAIFGYQAGVADFTFNESITSPSATAVPAPAVFPGVLAAGALGAVYRKRQAKKVSA
mgnify:CR=1 FL=1